MIPANILDLIRHGLTAVGAVLVSDGLVTSSQLTDLVGGVLVVISLAWNFYENHQQKPALQGAASKPKP